MPRPVLGKDQAEAPLRLKREDWKNEPNNWAGGSKEVDSRGTLNPSAMQSRLCAVGADIVRSIPEHCRWPRYRVLWWPTNEPWW